MIGFRLFTRVWGIVILLLALYLVSTALLLSPVDLPAIHPVFSLTEQHKRPFSGAVERLSAAIQHQTISGSPDKVFLDFHSLLVQSFPLVHQTLQKQVIGNLTLVYIWKASGPSSALPIMFMAHQDVVPIDRAEEWTHPPFSGEVADGYIWGRGALDIKHMLMGELEAVENLIVTFFF